MISFEIYKVMHLLGIALTLLGLGTILGANSVKPGVQGGIRKTGMASHGLGLFLALVGGFGMAARLGLITSLPGWIYGKIAIWILLAAGVSLAKRKPQWGLGLITIFSMLFAVGTCLAIFKP